MMAQEVGGRPIVVDEADREPVDDEQMAVAEELDQ
jgi:hypothetical protein